jgi:hypothetical protein
VRIFVSDTSVLIDRGRGGFLDSCFNLPFEFAVADLRARGPWRPSLAARGLRVEGLGDEVIIAQQVRSAHPKLSLPDPFVHALASTRGWMLLTGDLPRRALLSVAEETQAASS